MAVDPPSEVTFVENCTCLVGRMGNRCQRCMNRFTFDPQNGGQFARCVRCYCHNSPDICDPATGTCLNCPIGTVGDNCEGCAPGYYRNPDGSDCLPCGCPGRPGSMNYFARGCSVMRRNNTVNVVCDCLHGYTGDHCHLCSAGFFGNPLLARGNCQECGCSDIGSVMPVCNRVSH